MAGVGRHRAPDPPPLPRRTRGEVPEPVDDPGDVISTEVLERIREALSRGEF